MCVCVCVYIYIYIYAFYILTTRVLLFISAHEQPYTNRCIPVLFLQVTCPLVPCSHHLYVCVHASTCIYMYAQQPTHTYVSHTMRQVDAFYHRAYVADNFTVIIGMHVCMYVCMYVCMLPTLIDASDLIEQLIYTIRLFTYINSYTHTHIHTYKRTRRHHHAQWFRCSVITHAYVHK
jgi:hypothetical protein